MTADDAIPNEKNTFLLILKVFVLSRRVASDERLRSEVLEVCNNSLETLTSAAEERSLLRSAFYLLISAELEPSASLRQEHRRLARDACRRLTELGAPDPYAAYGGLERS